MKKIIIFGSALSLILVGLLLFSFHGRSFDMTGADAYWRPEDSTTHSTCLKNADAKALIGSKDLQSQLDGVNTELNTISAHLGSNVPAPYTSDMVTLAKKYAPNQLQHIYDLTDQYFAMQDQITNTRTKFESACK